MSIFYSHLRSQNQFQWEGEIIRCEFISATEVHLRPLSKTNAIDFSPAASQSNSLRKVHFSRATLQSALESSLFSLIKPKRRVFLTYILSFRLDFPPLLAYFWCYCFLFGRKKESANKREQERRKERKEQGKKQRKRKRFSCLISR